MESGELLYNPMEDPEVLNIYKVTQHLAKKSGLTKSMAVDLDYYFESYEELKEKIRLMIPNYVDSPEILTKLLEINDNMELIANKYRDHFEQNNSTDSNVENGSTKAENQKSEVSSEVNNISKSTENKTTVDNVPVLSNKENENDAKKTEAEHKKEEKEEKQEKEENQSNSSSFDYDPSNTEAFECPICMDEVEVGKGFVVSDCNHKYCLQCMKEYLNTLVKEGRVLDIPCCAPKCSSKLGYYDIKYCTDATSFQKYEEFTLLMTLKADPTVKWCPNPKGCGNALYTDQLQNGNNKIECSVCKYEFCKDCLEPWHTGTCEQFQQWKEENGKVDDSFSKYLKDHSIEVKKCPRCKMRIEKNEGCNHMTCSSCHFQFCWLCGGKYSDNHFSAFNPLGCPGMQFKNDKKVNKGKLIAKKVGIGTGIVLSLPLIIPAVIIGGPVYGGYRLHRWRKHGY